MSRNEMISLLIAEDDELDVQNIKRVFEKHQVLNPVYFAQDGLDAWNQLTGDQNHKKIIPTPKVLLLDINMPRVNGLELLEKIRGNKSLEHTLVFILSTSDDDKDILKARNLDVAGYILKPIKYHSFVEAMIKVNMEKFIHYGSKT